LTDLQELFDELDRTRFGGRLPAYRVEFADLPGVGHGICFSKDRLIQIHSTLSGEHLRRILLHEMCHHYSEGHGKRWQAEMLRLGSEHGETWAIEQVQKFREGPTWNQEMSNLRGNLDDWAAEEVHRDDPRGFDQVAEYAAGQFGLTAEEFLPMVPWLERAWENSLKTWLERKKADEEARKLWQPT